MKVLRVRVRGLTVLGILAAVTVVYIYLPPAVYRNSQLRLPSPTSPVVHVAAADEAAEAAPLLNVEGIKEERELPFLPPEENETPKLEIAPTPVQEIRIDSSKTVAPAPPPSNPASESLAKILQGAEAEVEHPLANDHERESYVQDYPDYTPPNFVEVKKIKPKVVSSSSKDQKERKKPAQIKVPVPTAKESASSPTYTAEALRNRALALSNSSSSFKAFLQEQDRRAQHVSSTCKTLTSSNVDPENRGMGPPPGLAGIHNLLLDRLQHIAYCPVYKAASTSWTITLLEIGGYWNSKYRKNRRLQTLVSQVFPKVSNYAGPALTRSMTRFMVVRHPFERLLSCYRDKFEDAKKEYYYTRYGEKMIRLYRKFSDHITSSQLGMLQEQVRAKVKAGLPVVLPGNPFAKPVGPTFPEFVQYVLHAKHDDEHWRTYHDHCSPCHMDYQFILRFEDMHPDGKQFIEYLNRTSQVHMRWENPTQGGSTTNDVICSYYNQLTVQTINELVNKYDRDFKLYEYKPDRYVKCASDYSKVKEEKLKIPAD